MTAAPPVNWPETARRLRVMVGHTRREALRMRLAVLLLLGAAGLIALSARLAEFNFGATETRFLGEFGLAAIALPGGMLAILLSVQLWFDDLQHGVLSALVAQALRRSEYWWGRWLGVAAVLGGFVFVQAGLLAAVLAYRAGAALLPVPDFALLAQSAGLVWLKLTLVCALTLLVCSYAGSALFASAATTMLVVAGHVHWFVRSGPGAWWQPSSNLARLDGSSLWSAGAALAGGELAVLVGSWALAIALCGGIGVYVFRQRQL